MARSLAAAVTVVLSLTSACSTPRASPEPSEPRSSLSTSPATPPSPSDTAAPSPSSTETTKPSIGPPNYTRRAFDTKAAMADVRLLAGEIGPRLATGPAFRRAGRVVRGRMNAMGYRVSLQRFPVPAGDSWGVPVDAGRSFNVLAVPAGFDPAKPHRLVGAHLDTVAVAPGAEDNASGVSVLLELARLAARREPDLPTVFVAFGAEEPRGPADDEHHFGSRRYVATMPASQARGLESMASLDRVGVGRVVPVCTGPLSPPTVLQEVLRTARRIAVPAQACENTASDHWSFEKAGFAVVRFGSTSYAAYHSAEDLPRVVSPNQLARTGRLAWAWLRD